MHSSVEGQTLIVAMFQGISDEESPIGQFAVFAHILPSKENP